MKTPRPLPSGLGREFSTAAAIAGGVGRSRLRTSDLERPFRGTRMVRDDDRRDDREGTLSPAGASADLETDLRRRIAAFATIMPAHAFFVGPTAAFLRGAPLPARTFERLHVGVLRPHTPPRRPGVRGHQLRAADIEDLDGYRVADVATTWATLADDLSEYDLVAATDYFIRIPRHPGGFREPDGVQLATPERLRAATRGRRRAGALARAVDRARTGSSSRPETHTRLAIVDGGLAEPELDFDVYDGAGAFIGAIDLGYRSRRIGLEYDGSYHRDQRQFEYDIDRHHRLRVEDWNVLRFTAELLYRRRDELVRRVAVALSTPPRF